MIASTCTKSAYIYISTKSQPSLAITVLAPTGERHIKSARWEIPRAQFLNHVRRLVHFLFTPRLTERTGICFASRRPCYMLMQELDLSCPCSIFLPTSKPTNDQRIGLGIVQVLHMEADSARWAVGQYEKSWMPDQDGKFLIASGRKTWLVS